MSNILTAINKWARLQPLAHAVTGHDVSLNYKELYETVCELQDYLEQVQPKMLAVLMDNSPAWVVIDLAAQAAGIPLLPIPGFFSAQQIKHTLEDTACDFIMTDQPERIDLFSKGLAKENKKLSSLNNGQGSVFEVATNLKKTSKLDSRIAKITYTSGTTGSPKGVCLRQSVIDAVAFSLCKTVEMHSSDQHLCVLPLATLLENIAGIYVPLLVGAQTIVYPLAMVGLQGAAEFNAFKLHHQLFTTKASTTVLVPHLLQQLIEVCEQSGETLSSLRFVAVGGAPISPELLQRASQCELPVFEGYGLSECASVVSVNSPRHQRAASVGKPLPHVNIRFADDGEILIKGARFSGYLGQDADDSEYLATGDIGYFDEDGFLYITGRKKNMFITAFGRNVSPEWVERELILERAIEQAAVFGEGRPWNVAVVVPALNSTHQDVSAAISAVNQTLPDYARIKTWLPANESFRVSNQLLTATGRLRRHAIWQQYAERIEALYLKINDPYRKSA